MATALSPEQREQLQTVLERRLSKVDDAVLLEIERLTRNPETLTGFVPHTKEVTPSDTESEIEIVEPQALTRRNFMQYSTSGVLGVFLLIAGYGWASKGREASDFEDLHESMVSRLRTIDSQVAVLESTVKRTENEAEECETALSAYRASYLAIEQSLLQAAARTTRMRELCDSLTELSSANNPEFFKTLLGVWDSISGILQMTLGMQEGKQYSEALRRMIDISEQTPGMVSAVETALLNLDAWFSIRSSEGIDEALFDELHSFIQAVSDDIVDPYDRFYLSWIRFMEEINGI